MRDPSVHVCRHAAKDDLLPIMDPLYNLREMAKQFILLEDHLAHERKRCFDCIRKHLLTTEALAEEAVTLDDEGDYLDITGDLAEKIRGWWTQVQDDGDLNAIGQEIRELRKELVKATADVKVATRMAWDHLAKKFEVNIGDPVLYGKYKNKRGVIVGFKEDAKGNPIVLVEPVPKGRKQTKELQLLRVWYDKARAEEQAKEASGLAWIEAWGSYAAEVIAAVRSLRGLGVSAHPTLLDAVDELEAVVVGQIGHVPRVKVPDDPVQVLHLLGTAGYKVRERGRDLPPDAARVAWRVGTMVMGEKSRLLRSGPPAKEASGETVYLDGRAFHVVHRGRPWSVRDARTRATYALYFTGPTKQMTEMSSASRAVLNPDDGGEPEVFPIKAVRVEGNGMVWESEGGARSLRAGSASRLACIIAVGEWGGSRCLFKNRDRNYDPEVVIRHEIRDGVEVAYFQDEVTGWVEGINEHGIGVVNTALSVARDEAEKKFVKNKGKRFKDSRQVLKALSCDDLDDAVDAICNFEGGLLGHTVVSNSDKSVRIEVTSKHKCIVKDVAGDEILVRTNHGIEHGTAGYTKGPDKESSHARFDQAFEALQEVKSPDEIAPAIYGTRLEDLDDPNNMVRDGKMWTSSQMVLDLTNLHLHLYLIPGKITFKGVKVDLPKGHKPKIKIDVHEYTDIDGDGEFDIAVPSKQAMIARVAARYKNKKKVKNQDGEEVTIYEYSERQVQNRNREKSERIEKLRHDIADLREQVKKDLSSKDDKTRHLALAVALMDETYERVGNEESAEDGHYGVTCWEVGHVAFSGEKATITYVGKSGVDQKKTVSTPAVVKALRDAAKGKKDKDQILSVSASDVNSYLKPYDITAKDIRGLHANEEMKSRLKAIRSKGGKLPDDKKDREKKLKDEFKKALEEAAAAVGHEPSTLRSQYLVPHMEDEYVKDGTIIDSLKKKSGQLEGFVEGFFRRYPKLVRHARHIKFVERSEGGSAGHGEARQHGDEVWIKPKFWTHGRGVQDFILAHEIGHWVLAEYGSRNFIELAYSRGVDPWDSSSLPFAQFNMEEAFADSFASYYIDGDVQRRYPSWTAIVEAVSAGRKRGGGEMLTMGEFNKHPKVVAWLGYAPQYVSPSMDMWDATPPVPGGSRLASVEARFIREVVAMVIATKDRNEKEDAEAERLVRRDPEKKPPRGDLRRRRVRDEDTDEKDPDAEQDRKDRSHNWKDVGGSLVMRVAMRHLEAKPSRRQVKKQQRQQQKRQERQQSAPSTPNQTPSDPTPSGPSAPTPTPATTTDAPPERKPGDVWETESGNWSGKNSEGEVQSFEGKDSAEAFARGQQAGPSPEDEAAQQAAAEEKARKERLDQSVQKVVQRVQEVLDDKGISKPFRTKLKNLLGNMTDQDQAAFLGGFTKQLNRMKDVDLTRKVWEAAQDAEKSALEGLTPGKMGETAALAYYHEQAMSNPMRVMGVKVSEDAETKLIGNEQGVILQERSREAYKHFRYAPEQVRKKALGQVLKELDTTEPDTPRYTEMKAIRDGLAHSFMVEGRQPPGMDISDTHVDLVRRMAAQGFGESILGPSSVFSTPEFREGLREVTRSMSNNEVADLIDPGSPLHPIAEALRDPALPPARADKLRQHIITAMTDQILIVDPVVESVSAGFTDPEKKRELLAEVARHHAEDPLAGLAEDRRAALELPDEAFDGMIDASRKHNTIGVYDTLMGNAESIPESPAASMLHDAWEAKDPTILDKRVVRKKTPGGPKKPATPKDRDPKQEFLEVDEKAFADTTPATDEDIKAFRENPAVRSLDEDFKLHVIAGGDTATLSKGDLRRATHIAAQLSKGIVDTEDYCEVNPPACRGNLGITRDNMPQIMDDPISKLLGKMDKTQYDQLVEQVAQAGGDLKKAIPDKKLRDDFISRRKGEAAIAAGANENDTPKEMWFNHLREQGISIVDDEIPVGMLSASQAEIKADKSYQIAKDYLTGKFSKLPDLPILVARDPKTGKTTVIDGHHRYAGLLTADPQKKMRVQVIEAPIEEALTRAFDVPGVFRADLQDNIVDPEKPLDMARKVGSTWRQGDKWYAKNQDGKAVGPFENKASAQAAAKGHSES